MDSKFKPGDLAIIVACTSRPDLAGCCVELVSRHPAGERFGAYGATFLPLRDAWIVASESVSMTAAFGRIINGVVFVAERNLMPLRGDFDFAREREQELTHG